MKGTTTGLADVYVDDELVGTVDLRATSASYQVNVWSTGPLPDGLHWVTIVRKDTSAAGKFVTLDAVDIYGTIASKPAPVHTVYDQLDTHIVYSPAWEKFTKTNAYGGSYSRTAVAGATATIYFTGTRLDVYGMTGTTTGVVDLYLDGVKKATIDMTATGATYKVMLWSTGTIGGGAHYVQLKPSDTSVAGKFITLDSVDIWGTIESDL
jgi:hypothetical protein